MLVNSYAQIQLLNNYSELMVNVPETKQKVTISHFLHDTNTRHGADSSNMLQGLGADVLLLQET